MKKLESLSQALNEWRSIIGHGEIILWTDNSILGQALKYQGENSQINKYLAKWSDLRITVKVKSESYKALRFAQCLRELPEEEHFERFEDLLTEYESTIMDLAPKGKKKNVSVNLEGYDFTGYFDGACSKRVKLGATGVFSWVLVNS